MSLPQPRHWKEVIFYTQVQWALTFPILRRHYVAYNIQCTLYVTIFPRFVPSAKGFLQTMLCFLTDSNQSISTCKPNLFDGFLTLVSQSICCVCFYTRAFSTAEVSNRPANLMCCIDLPKSFLNVL